MHYPVVTFRSSPRLLALIIPFLLSACGGGGGGGGGSSGGSTLTPVTPVVEPAVPATAASSKVGIIDSGLAPGRSEINYANVNFSSYVDSNTALNDNMGINGHGTLVAMTLLGL